MRRIVLTTTAACLMAGAAYAHALLDRASPAVGSEVSSPPSMLTLTYTEPVEPLFSTVHATMAVVLAWTKGSPSHRMTGVFCPSS